MSNKLIIESIREKVGNFRDIAEYCETYIKKGRVYRSGSPVTNQSPELRQLFKNLKINSIVDLRSVVEIGYESYDSEFLMGFNYYWVHLDISMPPEYLKTKGISHLPIYKQFCWYLLHHEKNKQNIARIFSILSDKKNYNVIIHCFAGRDRTGVISAIILKLMNVPDELIIQDYLASDEFTAMEDIIFVLDEISGKGGIEKYLEGCGVSKEQQEKVRRLLGRD